MELNIKKYIIKREMKNFFVVLLLIILNLLSGCQKTKNQSKKEDEKLTNFTLNYFSENCTFVLKGLYAEVIEKDRTKLTSPDLTFKTTTEIIEIKTDKEGKGEIKIDPENKRIKEIIISGKVIITYKDKKTGKITMEINCGKVTYIEEKKEMLFEEKPIIKRGQNIFSGEKIMYNLETNILEIKGNVNVEINMEKT